MFKPTYTECFCQVLKKESDRIFIYMGRFLEDHEEGFWMPIPPGMPDWCFDSSVVFQCELPFSVRTIEQLTATPWVMMGFCIYLNSPRRLRGLVPADERRGNRRYGDCQINPVASEFQCSA